MTIREDIATRAQALVGLTEPSEALGRLVDPGGTPGHQLAVERESLCMLVYRGLLMQVLAIPAQPAYVNGSIPAILWRILGGLPGTPGSAARVPTLESPPAVGDGMWWGAVPGHPEHVDAAVLEVEEPDPYSSSAPPTLGLSVVAGGQRDGAGHSTIAQLSRRLRWDGHRWICQATGRPVVAVLDADALAELYPDTVDVEPVAVVWAPVGG